MKQLRSKVEGELHVWVLRLNNFETEEGTTCGLVTIIVALGQTPDVFSIRYRYRYAVSFILHGRNDLLSVSLALTHVQRRHVFRGPVVVLVNGGFRRRLRRRPCLARGAPPRQGQLG